MSWNEWILQKNADFVLDKLGLSREDYQKALEILEKSDESKRKGQSLFTGEHANRVLSMKHEDAKVYAHSIVDASKSARESTKVKMRKMINDSKSSRHLAQGMMNQALAWHGERVIGTKFRKSAKEEMIEYLEKKVREPSIGSMNLFEGTPHDEGGAKPARWQGSDPRHDEYGGRFYGKRDRTRKGGKVSQSSEKQFDNTIGKKPSTRAATSGVSELGESRLERPDGKVVRKSAREEMIEYLGKGRSDDDEQDMPDWRQAGLDREFSPAKSSSESSKPSSKSSKPSSKRKKNEGDVVREGVRTITESGNKDLQLEPAPAAFINSANRRAGADMYNSSPEKILENRDYGTYLSEKKSKAKKNS